MTWLFSTPEPLPPLLSQNKYSEIKNENIIKQGKKRNKKQNKLIKALTQINIINKPINQRYLFQEICASRFLRITRWRLSNFSHVINEQFIARLGSCADIQQLTSPFLGFSVSPSQFIETLLISCRIALRILRCNVNTSNFTPLIAGSSLHAISRFWRKFVLPKSIDKSS